jgi:hypothetical protein
MDFGEMLMRAAKAGTVLKRKQVPNSPAGLREAFGCYEEGEHIMPIQFTLVSEPIS